MPLLGRATGQRVGSLGTIRSFVSVLRELSFDEVRDEAQTPPRLLVLAPDAATARRLGLALTGPEGETALTVRELNAPLADLGRFDTVVVHDPGHTGAAARARDRLPTEGGPAPVFTFEGDGPEDEAALERLRRLIATRLPDKAPAFGRAFPAFRPAAADAVIDETAKANAQFALVSNIPAVVPVIGSLAAAGADFLILTKNQLMMIFKLAAIHGRDLHDQVGILKEMVPVVGAGLFWRTLAREAASFVPLAAGTIPKVVIAYAGTLSAGRAADLYYRTNRKPTREQLQGYYRQAADAVRNLPLPRPGGNGNRRDAADGQVTAGTALPTPEGVAADTAQPAGESQPRTTGSDGDHPGSATATGA